MSEAAALVAAYLLGSVPIAWLIFKWRTGRDLRTVGDRNVGAANARREGAGHFYGAVIIILDIGKGLLAVSVARFLELDPAWWMAAGALVMVGHMYPVFLRFQGGRAAASGLGAAGAFIPLQFAATFVIGGVTYLVTRKAELGIFLVAAPLPFLAIAFGEAWEAVAFCFAAPVAAGLKTGWDLWHTRRQPQPPPDGISQR